MLRAVLLNSAGKRSSLEKGYTYGVWNHETKSALVSNQSSQLCEYLEPPFILAPRGLNPADYAV